MPVSEFSSALNQICAEKNISPEDVLETVKAALISAYRKDYGKAQEELTVELDQETGEARIFQEGKNVTPEGFGRIAAQTAKQVILQRIRESEKKSLIKEFEKKVGTIVSGYIFRIDKGTVIMDLGRTHGILPKSEQIPEEHYQLSQRLRVFVLEIKEGERGPEIILSRTAPKFVEELFALEVPEIHNGSVIIKKIAREPGKRTKIAVQAVAEKVDPVGSCVGQKGVRVQAVINELGNERVDIIPYSDDIKTSISNSLSPAKVLEVKISNEKKKQAQAIVAEDQLSLAIGKNGQNVRLAAKLTGWKLDIRGFKPGEKIEEPVIKSELAKAGLSVRVTNVLEREGINSVEALKSKSKEELGVIKGLGPKGKEEIVKILETAKK